jgi:Flp pilus assembly protein TadG
MNSWIKSASKVRAFSDERGQALVWIAFLLVLILGMSAVVIDLGHGMLVKKQLQASADAAALAAAATLPNTNYATVGQTYSAAVGSKNETAGYTITSVSVTPLCLSSLAAAGNACTATMPNAVRVVETGTFNTFFAGVIGFKTVNVGAVSTAARGSKPQPFNVAIILDTTPSMNYADTSCGSGQTELGCAEQGLKVLLNTLSPSIDNISLFTFPSISTDSVSADYCGGGSSPQTDVYTFPPVGAPSMQNMPITTTSGPWWNPTTTTKYMTYQILNYSGDYRSSDKSNDLSSSSNLVKAAAAAKGCAGMQTTSENTYYAAAIYAAQASLVAEQRANAGTQNVMIILSDGNATAQQSDMMTDTSQNTTVAGSSGRYPSWVGECSQGIDAANYATGQGTIVYTIAYGAYTYSSSGGGRGGKQASCASDRDSSATHVNVNPCSAMQQMSSGWSSGDHSHFFSDDYSTSGRTGCSGDYAVGDLASIFGKISVDLTAARVIPDTTP